VQPINAAMAVETSEKGTRKDTVARLGDNDGQPRRRRGSHGPQHRVSADNCG
jgi:hypothetical protein